MMLTIGHCANTTCCSLASAGRDVHVRSGDSFVCPQCGRGLAGPAGPPRGRGPLAMGTCTALAFLRAGPVHASRRGIRPKRCRGRRPDGGLGRIEKRGGTGRAKDHRPPRGGVCRLGTRPPGGRASFSRAQPCLGGFGAARTATPARTAWSGRGPGGACAIWRHSAQCRLHCGRCAERFLGRNRRAGGTGSADGMRGPGVNMPARSPGKRAY
jgi:hypothetical protein